MHDPMTVAFDVKYPWREYRPWPANARKRISRGFTPREMWDQMTPDERAGCSSMWPKGYRSTFITIWHVDPERDGSDDSCGFSFPRLTDHQRERLKNWAWSEAHNPYFLLRSGRKWRGTRHEAESMYRALLLRVAQIIEVPYTYEHAAKEAALTIHNSDCWDAADKFCFEPGHHTNFKEDAADRRQDYFLGVACGVARGILQELRPWYRHPRWHFWHWKIQVHPVQQLKRYLFSRCAKCGRGFAWGESPTSNSWHGTGPRWFRGEKDVCHSQCSGHVVGQQTKEVQPA
jgi:hypothetical protein